MDYDIVFEEDYACDQPYVMMYQQAYPVCGFPMAKLLILRWFPLSFSEVIDVLSHEILHHVLLKVEGPYACDGLDNPAPYLFTAL